MQISHQQQCKPESSGATFYQPKVLWKQTVFKKQRQNNDFWEIQKRKESITSKPEVQEMVKTVLQAGGKWY